MRASGIRDRLLALAASLPSEAMANPKVATLPKADQEAVMKVLVDAYSGAQLVSTATSLLMDNKEPERFDAVMTWLNTPLAHELRA